MRIGSVGETSQERVSAQGQNRSGGLEMAQGATLTLGAKRSSCQNKDPKGRVIDKFIQIPALFGHTTFRTVSGEDNGRFPRNTTDGKELPEFPHEAGLGVGSSMFVVSRYSATCYG